MGSNDFENKQKANFIAQQIQYVVDAGLRKNLSKTMITQQIKSKLQSLTYNPILKRTTIYNTSKINKVSYTIAMINGTLESMITLHGTPQEREGPPTEPGREPGQLAQDCNGDIYKWHADTNNWYSLMEYPRDNGATTNTNRFNSTRGRGITWGSSTSKGGYGMEPRASNPSDQDAWYNPGIVGRGSGAGMQDGIMGAFKLVVYLTKLFIKTDSAGKAVVETYGKKTEALTYKEENDSKEDTTKYSVKRNLEDKHWDVNTLIATDTVQGYQNAQRDSAAYSKIHSSSKRFNYLIEIKKVDNEK